MREGDRKETRLVADCSEVEKAGEEAVAAVDAGRQRMSFKEDVQILRTSSL